MKKMKNLKRILALITVFVMMFSFSCFAETEEVAIQHAGGSREALEIAKGMGVIGDLAGNAVMTAEDLSNAYMAITGVAPQFNTQDMGIEMISEMFVELLGYSVRKTATNTYRVILNSVGGFKGLSLSEKCTVSDFAEIFKNVLGISLMEIQIKSEGNSYIITDETFLNKYFSASEYTITVTQVMQSSVYVKAQISEIMDEENLAGYYKSGNYNMTFGNTSLLASYKNADIIAYVNKNDEILYWYPVSDSGIIYSYITSVNGSENETRSYYGKFINVVRLEDVKYNLSASCVITYNGANAENTSHPYVGHFAKAITENGVITKLDVYTLSEGGLFQKVDGNALYITMGMGQTKKIKNIDSIDNINVVVDGMPSSLDAIEANTLVDVYQSESELLLVGSAYVITDFYKERSTNYIKLSGSKYYLSTSFNVYYSNTDGEFLGSSDSFAILNNYCDVYLDYKGEVRYVKLNKEVSGEIKSDFYILLTGIETANSGAFSNSTYKLRYYKLVDGKCDEVISETDEDIVLPDTLANMQTNLNVRDTMEKNIYVLRTNDDGIITSIKSAETEKEVFLTKNNDHITFGSTRLGATGSDGSLFSSWNSDMEDAYAITIVDGKAKIQAFQTGWPGGTRYGQVTACYVVSEMATKADIVLCWSTKYDDGIMYSYESSQGIVTDVSLAYDEEKGESVNRYSIMKTDGSTLELDAQSGTEFDILKKGLLFTFKSGVIFGEYPIYLAPTSSSFAREINGSTSETQMLKVDILDSAFYNAALDYTDYIDSEKARGVANKDLDVVTNKTQLYKDTIYIYGDKRIWFGPKNLYGVNTIANFPVFKIDLANGDFELADDSDISSGQEIYFSFNGSRAIDFVFILD